MRTFRRMAASTLLLGWSALAAPNDFVISKLGDPTDPLSNANANFQAFAKEMGAALSTMDLMPPDTLGHSGFSLAAELSVVSLKASGTVPVSEPSFLMPTERTFSGTALLPSLHVRKGLPWSFEVGARVGWMDRSDLTVATMEAKWAGNEGFAYLPDVAARVYATGMFNTKNFELGVGGIDLSVGKQFAVGGMVTFTPYLGWNLAFVSASTKTLVDFNPGRTEDQAYAPFVAPSGSQTAQVTQVGQYKEVLPLENAQNRFYFGVRFIGGVIQVIGELSAAGLGTINVVDASGQPATKQLPPVLSVNTALGLDF